MIDRQQALDLVDDLQIKVQALEEENAILKQGLESVRNLINSSEGVVGLHLNSDNAEWEDLEEGGCFEEWLLDFNKAEELI